MLRAMWRVLETGLRKLLNGHEDGNVGYSQGVSYGLPRQRPTLPGRAFLGLSLANSKSLKSGADRIAHARSDYSTSPPDHNNSETRSTQRGARRISRIGCYQTSVTDPQPFASACAKSLRAGSAHRWNLFVLD